MLSPRGLVYDSEQGFAHEQLELLSRALLTSNPSYQEGFAHKQLELPSRGLLTSNQAGVAQDARSPRITLEPEQPEHPHSGLLTEGDFGSVLG